MFFPVSQKGGGGVPTRQNKGVVAGASLACPTYCSAVQHMPTDMFICASQELILFSRADLERSIPSMVDGLKPGQRKIMFSAFKRNLNRDIKVGRTE